MHKRHFLRLAAAMAAAGATGARAQPGSQPGSQPLRIGLLLPMTGPFASTGRQQQAAARLYLAQHGDTVAGRKIELLVRDDTGVADVTRRLAQELVVNDKVDVLAGFGLTPLAFAAAPIATKSKTPMVVTAAGTSSITEGSPFIVRTSYTIPQTAVAMAEWAARNQIRKVVTLVSDYGPGIDGEKFFKSRFTQAGGSVVAELRVPPANPDFAPFLQRVRDAAPDALYVFVPSGAGAALMRQFTERGMDKAGIRLIGDGGVTDDDLLPNMGDAALGVITAMHYSAAHDSAANRTFVEAFVKANGFRPNFMAVGAYDGLHVVCEAARNAKGAGGEALLAAMKGLAFESPRGPVRIDPDTRDIVQNIYLRRVERVGGQLHNVEFDAIQAMKDPGKAK